MINIEIIICTESGILEAKSKLLVYSIREFGGRFKKVPIISYQPRNNFKVSNETISFFEKNNVKYIDLDLNKEYCDYPLANKPIVCAHREINTKADILVFLDSDVFILNEPIEFIEFEDADVILRPVDFSNIGIENLNNNDINSSYWKNLYELLNVQIQRNVLTTCTNENILEYYNSGHIVTLTKNGLFKAWNENFNKVMNSGIKPNNTFFLEQSVFSATVSQLELKVKEFSKEYNYPISKGLNIKNNRYFLLSIDQLVSVHHHKYFEETFIYNSIAKDLFNTEKGKKIMFKIKEYEIDKYYSLISKIKFRVLKLFNRILRTIRKGLR